LAAVAWARLLVGKGKGAVCEVTLPALDSGILPE
jgi:hypothetical protein